MDEQKQRGIGEVGNYYGGLVVKTEGGRHYWAIECWSGTGWEEISPELFAALNAHQDTLDRQEARRRGVQISGLQ